MRRVLQIKLIWILLNVLVFEAAGEPPDDVKHALQQIGNSYRANDSVQQRAQISVKATVNGETKESHTSASYEIIRPDSFVLDFAPITLVMHDGSLRIYDFARKRRISVPTGERPVATDKTGLSEEEAVLAKRMQAVIDGAFSKTKEMRPLTSLVASPVVSSIVSIMLDQAPDSSILREVTSAEVTPGDTTTISIRYENGRTMILLVDSQKKLKQVDLQLGKNDLKVLSSPANVVTELAIRWKSTSLSTDHEVVRPALDARRKSVERNAESFKRRNAAGSGERVIVPTPGDRSILSSLERWLAAIFG